jgi:hypothetical protein
VGIHPQAIYDVIDLVSESPRPVAGWGKIILLELFLCVDATATGSRPAPLCLSHVQHPPAISDDWLDEESMKLKGLYRKTTKGVLAEL